MGNSVSLVATRLYRAGEHHRANYTITIYVDLFLTLFCVFPTDQGYPSLLTTQSAAIDSLFTSAINWKVRL